MTHVRMDRTMHATFGSVCSQAALEFVTCPSRIYSNHFESALPTARGLDTASFSRFGIFVFTLTRLITGVLDCFQLSSIHFITSLSPGRC
jgi:hypothetical protein